MNDLLAWAKALAMAWGGPGLFFVAFLDASFVSLPGVNDILVIWLVMQHKDGMLFYALMATLGSLAGCYVIYGIGRAGGEALLRRRYRQGKSDRAMTTFRRYGLLAVLVPSILPPPAPFKIFVLLAGVTRIRLSTFSLAVVLGRGFRYIAIGLLAVWYGEHARDYLLENGTRAALFISVAVLAGGLFYVLWSRRRHAPVERPNHTATSDSSASAG